MDCRQVKQNELNAKYKDTTQTTHQFGIKAKADLPDVDVV